MIIISNKPGQLGNRLILFSHLIAFSKEHQIEISNPSFDEYSSYFSSTYRDLLCRFPSRKSFIANRFFRRIIFELSYYAARLIDRFKIKTKFAAAIHIDWHQSLNLSDIEFVELARNTKFLFIQGWNIRGKEYFHKHADLIKNSFRPLLKYELNTEKIISGIRANCDILIGVHIRHGDYREFQGGKYFFETKQYIGKMQQAAGLFSGSRVSFFVCSNEKQDKMVFEKLSCYWGSGHLIEDMYGFAKCDYIMGPPSTYTLWASFWGDVPLYSIEDIKATPSLNNFRVYMNEKTINN